MAVSNSTIGSGNEIKPYQFEPVHATGHSDSEDDSSKSETEIREQASFTEHLGTIDWYECAKCTPIPSGIECQCCCKIDELKEHLMEITWSVSQTMSSLTQQGCPVHGIDHNEDGVRRFIASSIV